MPDQSWWEPATGELPLTQGDRIRNEGRARKRKFRRGRTTGNSGFHGFPGNTIAITDRIEKGELEPQVCNDFWSLTAAQFERLDGFATGELADACDNLITMVEELVAYDGMAGKH